MKTFRSAAFLLSAFTLLPVTGWAENNQNPKVVNCPVFEFVDIVHAEKNEKGIYILKSRNNDGTYNYTIKMSKSGAEGTAAATAKLKVEGKMKPYLTDKVISASDLEVSPPTISNLDPEDGPFTATIDEVKLKPPPQNLWVKPGSNRREAA